MQAPMTKCWLGPLACALVATLGTGCSEVQYRSATTHDEVVDITEKQVASGQHVKLKQEGRLLSVDAAQLCDLVEDKEIERSSVRKSDENVWVETLLMGLSTAPLTTGAVVLHDSQYVHDSDIHGRLYNSTGQSGAQAAGVASLVLGAGMLVGGMISLIRRASPDVTTTTLRETGDVLVPNQPCHGALKNGSFAVVGLLDNGQQVALGQTNAHGRLTVDLARHVAPRFFDPVNPPLAMQVQVGTELHGLIDLEPVAAHHQRRLVKAWSSVDREGCDLERTQAACATVQSFLNVFPHGAEASLARALMANIGQPRADKAKLGGGKPARVATSACEHQCQVKCAQNATCAQSCAMEQCR